MHPLTGAAMYLVIWWTVLFAVLPWGTRPVAEADPQTGWRGVPARPRIGMKMLATSGVAAVVWGLCYLAITSDSLSFRDPSPTLPTR